MDLLSSFASLTGQKLPSEAGPDSLDVLPALLGQSKKGRESLVEHAGALSLVVGDWKVIEAHPGPKTNETRNELGNDASPQLFHISEDPGEQINVAAQNPGKVKEMLEMLNKVKAAGRSRM